MAKSIQLVVIAMVVMAASLGAQTKPKPTSRPILTPKPAPKPNFTGQWVIVSPAADAGKEQIVTQDDKTLTTEPVGKGSTHKIVYQLDGVERRLAIPAVGLDVTMLARASWEGDHIVIAINASYSNGMKTHGKETWSLDAQGRLVIDATETGPAGNAGPVETKKIIYAKKK